MADIIKVDYETRDAMQALRGKLSQRATSAEFNEWSAREVCEYIDILKADLEEAKGIIGDCQQRLASCLPPGSGISPQQCISDLLEILDGPRARAFLKDNENVG